MPPQHHMVVLPARAQHTGKGPGQQKGLSAGLLTWAQIGIWLLVRGMQNRFPTPEKNHELALSIDMGGGGQQILVYVIRFPRGPHTPFVLSETSGSETRVLRMPQGLF